MTLWSSPHPKESAALSLGQAQQGVEAGKIKELVDPGAVMLPSSATSFASDGSEDAGFEDGPIDVDMADEETEGIQIDCIQTLTEFEPIAEGATGSPIMSDYKTAIPLPAPPMVGSAYGGNQAYVNYQSALPRIMERPTSPLQYWSTPSSASDNRLSSRVAGDVGLNNIGNTCFMNSGLQCLLHTSPLVEFFVGSIFERTATSLVYQFHSLMKHTWFGFSNAISLHDFKLVLGNKYAQFKDCRQHDCQEFLAVLLDMLHEELKSQQKTLLPAADSSVGESFIEDCTASGLIHKPETNLTVVPVSPSPSSSQPCTDDKNDSGEGEVTTATDSNWNFTEENNSKNTNSPVYKRLKLEEKGDNDVETTTGVGDDVDSFEVKRKPAGLKPDNVIQFYASASSEVGAGDEQVDVEHLENEAVGSSGQVDEDAEVNKPNCNVNPVQKAQEYWTNYMEENNTVIASTFQGMFKSSVTCSECSFISETYEPFMYLSLPIPRVMEKQLYVTFISMKDRSQMKVELTLHLMETVEKLISEVVKKVDGSCFDDQAKYVAAEIFNHRVSRVLDEKLQLRNLSTNNRNIYVYELNDNFDGMYASCNNAPSCIPSSSSSNFGANFGNNDQPATSVASSTTTKTTDRPPSTVCSDDEEDWEVDDTVKKLCNPSGFLNTPSTSTTSTYAPVGGGAYDATASSSGTFNEDPLLHGYNDNFNRIQCNICLEDYPRAELKQHRSCSCVLCEDCLMKSVEHFQTEGTLGKEGSFVKCAVCLKTVECKRAFVSLEESTSSSSPPEFITLSVIFRNEPGTDANNNSSWSPGLFGYPWIIRIPSYMNSKELVDYLELLNPAPEATHRLLSVKSDGKSCGQCVFSSRCNGCEIPREGMISLSTCNSVLISYTDLSSDRMAAMQPPDMAIHNELTSSWQPNRHDEPTIDIHDCLRTFSETEHLDEQNPWYCPKCKKNQRATKALSICKFPDYLIVYLKRFVFLDQSSNKLNNRLTFPVNDLDVSDYVTEGFGTDIGKYNLYSCVCHFGSASVGHYTAFAKNPVTSQWHYFNDDTISERSPAENEYASAYVLFYEKQGMRCNIPTKCSRPLPELNSFNSTTTFTADTRGSYLPGESSATSSAPGPVRLENDLTNEMNRMVDSSTSVTFTYPQTSTETENDLLGLDVDEGVGNETSQIGEIRDDLGLTENEAACVSSSTAEDELIKDLEFDNVGSVGCSDLLENDNDPMTSSTSTIATQHYELSSSSSANTGGADSTSN